MDDVRGTDPLTEEDLQQKMLLLQMMLASNQNAPPDPIDGYLKEMQRQDEERKKQEARRSQSVQSQSPFGPPPSASGSGGRSGAQNVLGAVNTANTLSNAYNGQSLVSNLMSLFA